ncbi:MFS general substrate transporter [Gymnopus androsaceus JB14]|uniref:MFS general substrate transporter n=1 Tax=Gymnopus androsaceus JB14 TaxID=1447944 RepID=A0A6A4HL78_9AGAR|nr:MFS general substrate transporter [Gymnopus androsaceus JB14]
MSIQTDQIVELTPRSVPAVSYHDSAESEGTSGQASVNAPSHVQQLPPVDGGFHAWAFLGAAFFIEALVWGFPDAFGVFLDAYLADPIYTSQHNASSLIPLIGPISSGIIYCVAPFITPLINRYPSYRRPAMYIGLLVCWASLFGASYTTKVTTLVALQGVLYALGSALLYFPSLSYLAEWFINLRGFANGVLFAGTGVGGIVLPLTISRLLSAYGVNVTVRILSVAMVVLLLPLLPLVKGRLPVGYNAVNAEMRPVPRGSAASARSWMRSIHFWVLMAANTIHGFAYFVPLLWLPTFASSLNLSTTKSSATITVFHTGSFLGRLLMGYLSDRTANCLLLGLGSLLATSVTTFVLWGVCSTNLAGLLAFSMMFGFFAGNWPSLWSGFGKVLTISDPTLSMTLFGMLLFSRGLGNIASTPISSALTGISSSSPSQAISGSKSVHFGSGFDVAGGRFSTTIVYVGTCFAGAGIILMCGWVVDLYRLSRSHNLS